MRASTTTAAAATDIARVVLLSAWLRCCISSLTNLFMLCAFVFFFLQLCSRFVRSHFDFNLYVLLLIFSSLVFMCLWCFCFLSYRHILFIIRSAFEMEKWSHKIFRCVCACVRASHLSRSLSQYVRMYNARLQAYRCEERKKDR